VARPKEHDETTRAALLEAAGRLLAAGGSAAVTTRTVAAAAGTPTRAIYVLFGSKDELLRALHREGFEGLRAELDAVPVNTEPLTELRGLAEAYRRSALARPHLYQVMFGPPIEGLEPAPEDAELAASTLRRLAEAVTRCQEAGLLTGDDPWPITRQLWALVHGLASLELRGVLGGRDEATAAWGQALRAAAVGYGPTP
jgi:AcrR family transcriptional regulator